MSCYAEPVAAAEIEAEVGAVDVAEEDAVAGPSGVGMELPSSSTMFAAAALAPHTIVTEALDANKSRGVVSLTQEDAAAGPSCTDVDNVDQAESSFNASTSATGEQRHTTY